MGVYEGNKPYIFISYAHKDTARVIPAIHALRNRGFRVWFDSGIEAGSEWPANIEDHLNRCAAVLVFMSNAAVNSFNCRNEINYALSKNPNNILIVYLEDTDLHHGMGLQLSTIQSLYVKNQSSKNTFFAELCAAKILQKCKDERAVSKNRAPKQQTNTPTQKNKPTSTPWYLRLFTNTPKKNKVARESAGSSIDNSATKTNSFMKYYKDAEQGDVNAQFQVGLHYLNGVGVEKDDAEAVKWFLKAALQNDSAAQYHLGYCYYDGIGIAKSLTDAVYWYQKAAEQGYSAAQLALGRYYFNGIGIIKDYYEAVKWFRLAAEQDNTDALFLLGYCYSNGHGVDQNFAEAFRWYFTAAKKGDICALYILGFWYEHGKNVEKDPAKAVYWYKKAAEKGHAGAQCNLGEYYECGKGVKKDLAMAIYWYEKAAEQGDSAAQFNLGGCYECGKGVNADLDKAIEWYQKAAAQRHSQAQAALARLQA